MKSKTLALLAAALMLLSGCGEEPSSSGVVIPEVTEGQTVTYGKVTYVAGNELTLAIGTLNEGGMALGASAAREETAGGQKDQMDHSDQTEDSAIQPADGTLQNGAAAGGDSIPMMGMAGGGDSVPMMGMAGGSDSVPMTGMPSDDSIPAAAMGGGTPAVRIDLTGEEEVIVVPVGVPVYAAIGTRNISTDFTQIMADNIVQVVWDTNEDGPYIAWLQVLS